MRGIERLAAVDRSGPAMARALPSLPMTPTSMVRLLRVTVVGLGQYFEPVFRSIGVSESAFHVLCLLMANDKGQASPSELAELVGTSRANMTRILDELVSDALVLRMAEVRDARRATIQITPRGREVAAAAIPQLAGPLTGAFEDLAPDDLALLESLLRKLIKSFDKVAIPLRLSA